VSSTKRVGSAAGGVRDSAHEARAVDGVKLLAGGRHPCRGRLPVTRWATAECYRTARVSGTTLSALGMK
jgi:hypothetical protein